MDNGFILLTEQKQTALAELFESACKTKNITTAFACQRAGVGSNIIERLRRNAYSRADENAIRSISQYLGCSSDIPAIINPTETISLPPVKEEEMEQAFVVLQSLTTEQRALWLRLGDVKYLSQFE